MPASLLPYRKFIQEVDALCEKLETLHHAHLSCRKGCFACCTDISVLAVEAFSILRGVGTSLVGISEDGEAPEGSVHSNACVFLDLEGACRIYPYRPLICRTHGLPLLYPILEYDEGGKEQVPEGPQWQLFYCDLNFQGVKDEDMEQIFTPETVLNMEEWNQRLVLINEGFRGSADGSSFIKSIYQGRYGESARKEFFQTGRIPLSSLGWTIL